MLAPIDRRVTEVLAEVITSVTPENKSLTVLSSGVVLRHKKVPPMILARIDEKFRDPEVPVIWDSEKERNIPNPDDPKYHEEVQQNRMDKGTALIDVLIALGTTIEFIPDGMQTLEDDEWVENLSFVGIEVPKLRVGRYLAWVKYFAAEAAEDIQKLAKKGAAALGVTEEDVASAIANFQSDETRTADTDSQAEV